MLSGIVKLSSYDTRRFPVCVGVGKSNAAVSNGFVQDGGLAGGQRAVAVGGPLRSAPADISSPEYTLY